MNFTVPVVINDPHQTTVEYWSTIYHGFTAKLAAKTATRVWKRCRLAEAQNWRCCWCGKHLTPVPDQKNSATIEHINPRSLGGSDEMDNLAAACSRCNSRRKTKPVDVFLAELVTTNAVSKRGNRPNHTH